MAASWRCVSEVERGARPSCGRDPKTGEDAAPIEVARAHARCGCTFKTCAVVAAWTLRADAGMSPGTTLDGLSRARWPGADAGDGGGDDGDGHRGGNGPEWARGDHIVPGDGKLTRDAAEAIAATTGELAEHANGLSSLRVAAETAENAARDELDRLDAEAGGWLARGFGHAMHLRHPLRLASACGYPEWTNFVSGFRGALITSSPRRGFARRNRCRCRPSKPSPRRWRFQTPNFPPITSRWSRIWNSWSEAGRGKT